MEIDFLSSSFERDNSNIIFVKLTCNTRLFAFSSNDAWNMMKCERKEEKHWMLSNDLTCFRSLINGIVIPRWDMKEQSSC